MKGYCFKCKGEREMEGMSKDRLKNKRMVARGRCKSCQTRITKFL
jgi:hypothetical protein